MVLEDGWKGSGNVSGMGYARNAVSNDLVDGGYTSGLEAHPVTEEEGAVDTTEGVTTRRVFASFAGPRLTGSVVGLDPNHQVRVRGIC